MSDCINKLGRFACICSIILLGFLMHFIYSFVLETLTYLSLYFMSDNLDLFLSFNGKDFAIIDNMAVCSKVNIFERCSSWKDYYTHHFCQSTFCQNACFFICSSCHGQLKKVIMRVTYCSSFLMDFYFFFPGLQQRNYY